MGNTLAQYRFLGNDAEVRAGIAKTILMNSPWLRDMPFVELKNNNISRYKMELAAAGADTYEVGETWQESTPTWEYREAPLAILGGDADVDNFGSLASGHEADMAVMIELKSKAIADWFNELGILGQTTAVAKYSAAKNFKGLMRLIAEAETASANTGATDWDGSLYTAPETGNNKQVAAAAASASAVLTLDMLDTLISLVKPAPTHLIMNPLMARKVASLARAAGNNLVHDNDALGMPVTRYGQQIILTDDWTPINMPDASSSVTAIASYTPTTARAAGNDISPIFAVRFGEDGLCGINGEGMIQVERFDKLETKDARRVRIKFYAGMRLTNKRAAAVLSSVNEV